MILLTTLNARFSHAALGLRYLVANMGALKAQTRIIEFTIQQNIDDIVEIILENPPEIIGIGVYIWNIFQTTQLIKELKILRPDIIICIGGPEVSYEYENTEIFKDVDYLITGWGDVSFPALCTNLLETSVLGTNKLADLFIDETCINEAHIKMPNINKPHKVIKGVQPKLVDIILPYAQYSEHDIKHRTIYVEASRGCPFKCEFCLSSLDKTAWSFPLESFMAQMELLYTKGLRQFKFVDRTFNLKKEFTSTILNFFLDKLAKYPENNLFLHFELVPDYLSDDLKELILKFPDGALQFEIGIQTLYPKTQQLISRKTNLALAKENITWLTKNTKVHLHVDLIAGLPAEDWDNFAKGFNELWSWQPHEIQLGILKRLNGVPIIRHSQEFAIKYSKMAPYSILENKDLSFTQINDIKRIAKYWDLVANSGRFKSTLATLLADNPFENMHKFSKWLFCEINQTHSIALDRLFTLVYKYLTEVENHPIHVIRKIMSEDFMRFGLQGWPKILGEQPDDWKTRFKTGAKQRPEKNSPKRQLQHDLSGASIN
ncbi:B12-binding domain-containing radical SAM protein [Gammaproteobacteria bacterium]|nr:B12-binding domain-containing radical SAM protein [Gammaproteobacteria bacterium]